MLTPPPAPDTVRLPFWRRETGAPAQVVGWTLVDDRWLSALQSLGPWWIDLSTKRSPRVRVGRSHVYQNRVVYALEHGLWTPSEGSLLLALTQVPRLIHRNEDVLDCRAENLRPSVVGVALLAPGARPLPKWMRGKSVVPLPDDEQL